MVRKIYVSATVAEYSYESNAVFRASQLARSKIALSPPVIPSEGSFPPPRGPRDGGNDGIAAKGRRKEGKIGRRGCWRRRRRIIEVKNSRDWANISGR